MLSKFIQFVSKKKLYQQEDKILLGVSGGIDSMVMANLFIRGGYSIGIAHCNFKLRGTESDADEEFVAAFANRQNIPFFTEHFKTHDYALQHKVSIQMAARDLRMNWFCRILKEKGYDSVATAHHLDDQAETFFINLLRGTGLAGLHGIMPKSGWLSHPMLFATRDEIVDYAESQNLPFREDSSNLKTKYLRNTVRLRVIPELEKIQPDFTRILAENIDHIRAAENILANHLQAAWNAISEKKNGLTRINLKKLNKFSEISTYLFEFLKPFGFNSADAALITDSLESQPGKIFLSKTHRLILDREYLLIDLLKDPVQKDRKFLIPADVKTITNPVKLKISFFSRNLDFKPEPDPCVAQLDADRLEFPLKIRKWEKGDYFYPLGMKGKKLLSDFYTDKKINQIEKENSWLLLSGDNIIWIIGHRIDDRFKISTTTKTIVEFTLTSK